MTTRSNALVAASILAVTSPLLYGSSGGCLGLRGAVDSLTPSIDRVNATLSQGVQTLGDQSSQWQGTLKGLENKLAQDAGGLESQVAGDVRDIINQIDGVMKDGLQFGQESFNCQSDIFSGHARTAVQNLLLNFLNKWNYQGIANRPLVAYVPIVCSVNPTEINVMKWDSGVQLILSGTDLNLFGTTAPETVLKRYDGAETSVPSTMVNPMTNYRVAINVPEMISMGLFAADTAQLVVRWKGRQVNANTIAVVACGEIGQTCCGGGTCAGGASCDTGMCRPPCGALGQTCCSGGTCKGGASCDTGTCRVPCGQPGQACCSGGACLGSGCVQGACKIYSMDRGNVTGSLGGGGGDGGGPFSDWCDVDSVAVGLQGRGGTEVDGLQLLCARLAPDGSPGSSFITTPYRGGNGGGAFSSRCPAGMVLIGTAGRSGTRTDQIQGRCASVSYVVGPGGDRSDIGPWGGTGGGPFPEVNCPAGMAIAGISGRSGTRLDQNHFMCAAMTLR